MHTDRKAPRGMMALAAVLSLTGFILFLLVTLSAPIISSISFTRMTSDDSATTLDTGVFGVCYRVGMGTSFSALRFGIANPQNPDPNVTQRCTRIGLGWLARISPRPEIDFYEIAPPSFARALVLNVIAAAFAASAMLSAAISVCSPGRVMGVITVGLLSLATLFAWPAFGVDIAFSRRTRDHLEGIWDSWHVQLGNANWLALGGAIALTLALVFAIVTLLQSRRPPAREPRFAEPNMRKTSTVNSSFETGRA